MVPREGALVVDFVGVHRVAQRSSLVLVLLVQVELPRGRFGGSEQGKEEKSDEGRGCAGGGGITVRSSIRWTGVLK
jgi:hypothetical protein